MAFIFLEYESDCQDTNICVLIVVLFAIFSVSEIAKVLLGFPSCISTLVVQYEAIVDVDVRIITFTGQPWTAADDGLLL